MARNYSLAYFKAKWIARLKDKIDDPTWRELYNKIRIARRHWLPKVAEFIVEMYREVGEEDRRLLDELLADIEKVVSNA